MKKLTSLFIFLTLFLFVDGYAQLTGIKTIPGDYATIAAAVTDVNTAGVGSGGVTFNVAAGYTESITAPILLTATGTQANPVTFQKNGTGDNPLVTRTDAGSHATTTLGAQGDAVIIIEGSDYVTFNGIDVAVSDAGIEYGYYLRKTSVTDGCKFVTVKNAKITMTKGTSTFVVGIYSSNNDANSTVSSATGITVTSVDGRNESVSLTGNTISNVFAGIVLRGYGHAVTPYDFYDQNFVVGAEGAGNTIQNFAGNSATTSYGVYLIYQNNADVSYNTINNTNDGGTSAIAILYGIFHSTGTLSSFKANSNSINLTQGGATHSLYGINSTATGNLEWNNNNLTLNTSAATSGLFGYLYNGSAIASSLVTISNNTFNGSAIQTTGGTYLIYNNSSQATPGVTNVFNNVTSGSISKTGASGTFYGYYNNGSPTGTENIYDNMFSDVVLTGTSGFYGILSTTASAHTSNVFRNTVKNITAGTGIAYGIHLTLTTRAVYDNKVYGITGGGTVHGISIGSGASNVYKNSIYNLTSTAVSTTAGVVNGIYISGANAAYYFYNNFISDLKAPASAAIDAVRGISSTGTTASAMVGLYYNTIFINASSTGANFGTSGIFHTYSATATSAALDMRNNIVVNSSTPVGTGFTAAFRRSAATSLANYSEISNNNSFYAGTPGAANLIFYDGTNADQTLADFKTRVAPREGASVSVNPAFINSTVAPYNLHIDSTVISSIEGGGAAITAPLTITTDFDGDNRHAGIPDIGADEFTGAVAQIAIYGINPQSKDFGNQQIEAQSAPTTFTVSNSGGLAYSVNSVVKTGANAASFSLTDNNTYPMVLAQGASLSFSVVFAPADTGVKTASIIITHTADGSPDTVELTGRGKEYKIVSFPYSQGFEDGNVPPIGWSNPLNYWNRTTQGASGAYAARVAYNFSTVNEAILQTSVFNLPANHRISFWWKDNDMTAGRPNTVGNNSNAPVIVGHDSTFFEISTDGGTSWTTLALLSAASPQTAYIKVEIDLSAYAGSGRFLRWRDKTDGLSAAYGTGLDDILIEELPAIPIFSSAPTFKDFGNQQIGTSSQPQTFTVSNLGGAPLTINSASIWGSDSLSFVKADTNTYPKVLGATQSLSLTVAFAPANIGAKSGFLRFTTLDPAEEIYLDTLVGSGVDFTITTLPYSQGFEDGVVPPAGWSNPGNYWKRSTESKSGLYSAGVSYNYSAVNEALLISPPVNLPTFSKITFWWKDDDPTIGMNLTSGDERDLSNSPRVVGQDTTFFEISTDGGTTWTTLKFLSAPSSMSAYQEEIIELSSYAGNGRILRFRDKTNATGSAWGAMVDDILIEEIPQITMDWNNLQWPASATITAGETVDVYTQGWENNVTPNPGPDSNITVWIGVSNANTNPNTWTTWIPAAFNSQSGNNDEYKGAIGTNLAPGTYYYASRWQLQNGPYTYGGYNAGGGGFWDGTGNVSGVLTVTPFMVNNLPYTEGFENTNFPPLGWSVVNVNSDLRTWIGSTSAPNSGSRHASYPYSGTLDANDWLISPGVTLEAGKTYRVIYYYRAASATFPEKMKVAIGSMPLPDSLYTVLADHPNIVNTTYNNNMVILQPVVSGMYYFGFHAYSIADQFNLYLDDVAIVEVPPVDYAVAGIVQLNGIPTFPSEAVNGLVKGEEQLTVNPSTLGHGVPSGLTTSTNVINGNSTYTDNNLQVIGQGQTPYNVQANVPVSLDVYVANAGLTNVQYVLNGSIAGVDFTPIPRVGVDPGAVDTVNIGATVLTRGTVTTIATVFQQADTINTFNNMGVNHKTLVYPDSTIRNRYDNGGNVPNTFIGFSTNNISLYGAVRFTASAHTKLTNVDAYYRTETSSDSVMVGIWGPGADGTAPGALLYMKKFGGDNYLSAGGAYITLPLGDDAPGFQSGTDYWISLAFNAAIQFPLGAHNSPLTTAGRSYLSQDTGKTWVPLVVTTERAWFIRSVGVAWQLPALTTSWEKSKNKNNLPTWFSPTGNTERGLGYGMVGGNKRLYVVSRNGGLFVRVINAITGNDAGVLDVTGIAGGTFALNDAGVTADGKILAANLKTTAADTFRVYMWNDEATASVKVVDYAPTQLVRLGDKITVVGDFSNNSAEIWAASGTAGVGKVYIWKMTAGAFNAVPDSITLSDGAAGGSASVGTIPGGGFYWNSGGNSAKKYSADGTLLGTVPGTVVATGTNAIRYVGSKDGIEYFATYQYGGGNENARVVGIPASDFANAFTFGLTPTLGNNSNVGGTGDLEVRRNPDGTVDLFVLGTNNGFGLYHTTAEVPVELTAFAAAVSGVDVVLNWSTASEVNNSGFSVEKKSVGGEFASVTFIEGKGNTAEMSRYTYTDKSVASGSYIYRLKQIDFDGSVNYSPEVEVLVEVPTVFELAQNYPNPFNPSTTIKFALPKDANVTLSIYSILGEKVATIVNGALKAGNHTVIFDAAKLSSGLYIYKMEAGEFSAIRKMMFLK